MQYFRPFTSDARGNTTVMLALALVPMLVGIGAAIDMVQTNQTLTVLQGAADAAALAGGSSHNTSDAQLREIVKDYLTANGAISALNQVDRIESKLDKKSRTFTVSIAGQRKTSLMHLAGINTMDLMASSEVKLGGDGLEVALVLDVTASMNAAGRLPALKDAAKLFVKDVLGASSSDAYVRVGIVPFSNYVNVGISRRGASWLDVDADKTEKSKSCWATYPNAKSSNCRQVPNIVDGVQQGMAEQCDWNYGKPVEQCGETTVTYTWNGCVGSRPEPLDEKIGSLSTRYKGLTNEYCGSEMVELTDNTSKLNSTIDGFSGVGETYIAGGLLWGWNMLDSVAPLDKAKSTAAIKEMGGTKAMVLMTDGQNTLASYAPYHWGADPADGAKGDAKTETLCNTIKSENIVVYTVSFMVTDPDAKSLMAQCASDSTKAYTADNAAALTTAFKDIGASLMAMRVSK